jgi:hypothetical protein
VLAHNASPLTENEYEAAFARVFRLVVSIMYGPPPDCKRFEVERSNESA